MECPVKHHGFARLPGQTHDNGARALRDLLERDKGELLEKLLAEYAQEKCSSYSYDHRIVSYATSSLVIEILWTYVIGQKSKEDFAELRKIHAQGGYEDRVQSFVHYCLKHLDGIRDRFVDDVSVRLKEGRTTKEDKVYLVFTQAQRKHSSGGQGLPVPSFNDLVVLVGRMAFVMPPVFARDLGAAPTNEEVFAMMRNSHTLGFFVELMANARDVTLPLISILQRTKRGDLDNLDYRFTPEFFTVKQIVGRPSVVIAESFVERYRQVIEQVTEKHTPLSATLGCPALYGGKFREIFYWVCTEFEDWMTYKE